MRAVPGEKRMEVIMPNFKRICSLLIALCLVVGFVPLDAGAEENAETRIVKQQILLGEDLTVRFFAYIREEHRTNSVMNIRVGNRTVSYTVAEMTPNAEGYYVFSVDISAPEMTEKITLSLENDAVNGQLKFSGVWFVSKEDWTKVQVGSGDVVKLNSGKDAEKYLQATQPVSEGGDPGAASTMVAIGEDPAWGGIASQATIKAAEGITLIGKQKSTVIDSPICEGYFSQSGATYPLLTVDCAWKELDTENQDLMFYLELPQDSSSIRLYALTCNSWSIYAESKNMHYQYLCADSLQWQNGTVSNDENRTLTLTPGFKGYVRLKVDSAINADTFPDSKKLTVQSFGFRGEAFGGDYGPIKLGGVWFVSKEDFTDIQVGDGNVVNMTTAGDRGYLLSTQPAAEAGENGKASSLITVDHDEAWGGIASQANMKAAWGLTPMGEYKSTVIDSPICEGYFNESGQTYPTMAVNCGWGQLDTETQDVMFYVELPTASSGLRIRDFTCNGWSFWVNPSGMQYQYLATNDSQWKSGTISADDNKNLSLPQGFKGFIRLKINTAKNAEDFPASELTVQQFTFQCDRFGGTPVMRREYTVRDYAEYILNNNYTVETKNLVRQMLHYGAKSQLYFGHRTHKLADADYEVKSTATIGNTAPEVNVSGAVDGISFYGCSMVFQSKLATRYYFRAPKGIDGYSFHVAGKEITPVAANEMFYVEESDITPDRMDTLTTVSVTKGSQELTVQYSPMYYITRMYHRPSSSRALKNMLLAATGYFDAAKAFTGVAENEYIDRTIELAPVYGTQDDALEKNPDRGWRLEAYVNVCGADAEPEKNVTAALEYYKEYNPQLCQVYFYLTDYKDTPTIPQEGFDRIQRVFDTARERGIKYVVRFAYQSDMTGTGEASDEIMLAHMPQLQPILAENTDVIHTVEAGFLGAWGEWHSYQMEHDELAILKGVLDMVPESLYVQVRHPRVKNLLMAADPNDPNLSRMGYHDDSFFGWQSALWNDGLNPGDVYWEQMRKDSPYGPQGGEMFWGCEYDLNNWAPTTGEMAIRKYSAFHQNSFSLYHSFIEDGFVHWVMEMGPGVGYYSIRGWQTEAVSQELLDSYGVAYDPLWFQNENAEVIERTAFEFVQDHLGYRLRALDVTLNGILGCGQDLKVSMNLKNTGFSAVFNMQSGFAVLDQAGKVISTAAAGDPTQWLAADPDTNERLTHTVAATLTLPETPGTYQIAFYLQNSAGTGARFANDLPFINGYTVLQTIELH